MPSYRRSRSRSRSRERLDRFGRVINRKSRSRSPRRRSRSRSRDHGMFSRSSSSRMSPRRSPRQYRRSRSRSSSRRRRSPRPKSKTPPIGTNTNKDDIELMKARVFVGNVPVTTITKKELEDIFSKYGKIIGLSLHDRGFAFVQYEKEEEALKAVENENGGLLKGSLLDVKMALDGRRGSKPAGARPAPSTNVPPPGYERDRYPPVRPGSDDRERSRERYPPPPVAGVERERSPLRADPYDDRYRDLYRDPPPPARRDDPYADAYRRPPPADDPYYDRYRDDPYRYPPPPPRRDPYADPYRDPYYRDPGYDAPPPARKPPTPIDCQIIILTQALMKFAEFVERKLAAVHVFCNVSLISEDQTIPQVVEDAAKKQCLFAIVVNSQNEVHQSLTVNILHGTPQEHRNMPVDDAISLIGRSFDAYQIAKREKEAAAVRPAAARAPPPFVPPSQDILYLLNLLADKRQLTVDELNKVIKYLTERRDKLLESEGRLPPKAYPDREPESMSERHLKRSLGNADMYSESPKALRTFEQKEGLTVTNPPSLLSIDTSQVKRPRLISPQPLMQQQTAPNFIGRGEQVRKGTQKIVQGGPKSAEDRRVMNKKVEGPPVLTAISDVIKTVCTVTANMFQLVERYNIPQNCLSLKPPVVQQEIYSAVNAPTRSYDTFLQNVHMQLAISVVPIIQTTAFFENSMTIDNEVVYQLLKDSMLLLCNLILEITVKRRNNLKPYLPSNQRWLCVRKMTIGEYFFPEEFLKVTEDVKYLKQAFDKMHKTVEEEKHIFAQQLLNKKKVSDTETDVSTWSEIAEFVSFSSTIPVNQQLVKKIREKYPIPKNCRCLRPPQCNESVWHKISNQGKNEDRDMQNHQRTIGHGIVPIIKMLESIKSVKIKPMKMFSMLKETLYILCTTMRDISSTRRRYLKAALPEPLKVRCERWNPITHFLCGDGTESYGGVGEPKADAQKDLQAKILSILNGPGEGGAGLPGLVPQPQGNGALDARKSGPGMSSLINLDNPNVQKALDNLIQSGPNLLKTLSHSPGTPLQPGAALMSRESQHTQLTSSIGRDPYGVPPPRGSMPMAGVRAPYAGGAGGQPRMPGPGAPPRRPPPQY